jgi:hypothetical protein
MRGPSTEELTKIRRHDWSCTIAGDPATGDELAALLREAVRLL